MTWSARGSQTVIARLKVVICVHQKSDDDDDDDGDATTHALSPSRLRFLVTARHSALPSVRSSFYFIRLASARLVSARLASARFGSLRLGSARLGVVVLATWSGRLDAPHDATRRYGF